MSNSKEPSFTNLIDLASEKLGGKALACSDDFFAPMHNLLKPGRGIFIVDKYTENGKWMDGWESRRKRTEGHDWCIIKLGATGIIRGVDVDTNHFLGNHPPHCSIEACYSEDDDLNAMKWTEILPKSPLEPDSQHFFDITNAHKFTHLKLHIYPDGGVARLKVYGEVVKDWQKDDKTVVIDLAAAVNGGKSIGCNDMFFSHMDNLIMPGKGVNMGDGWETKRNRTPNNHDWVTIRLAHKGKINRIMLDTHHFKGNYPDSCLIEGCVATDDSIIENQNWKLLLPLAKLQAHKEHIFEDKIENQGPFTHVRLSIFPDGGISRLRLFGTIE
ncbi:MAG: allantoicase [Cyclobacteriaceae bacterium]|nr:allantoicase [Cyclobacteriaceae bacterium]